MLKLIIIFLLLTSPVQADEWTREDTYRESVYMTLHTVDWLQTRSVAKAGWPDGRSEMNPLLGTTPSVKRLDAYYLITSIGHIWIAHLLPPEWRVGWQYIAIGDAGTAAFNNHLLGVRIKL